jgi:hypothetical protein
MGIDLPKVTPEPVHAGIMRLAAPVIQVLRSSFHHVPQLPVPTHPAPETA